MNYLFYLTYSGLGIISTSESTRGAIWRDLSFSIDFFLTANCLCFFNLKAIKCSPINIANNQDRLININPNLSASKGTLVGRIKQENPEPIMETRMSKTGRICSIPGHGRRNGYVPVIVGSARESPTAS